MIENHCRHFLSVSSLAVSGGTELQITVAQENLVDGFWYSLRLNHAVPTLTGTETVVIINGTQTVQLADWRGRRILSERLLRGGERLRMVYTENGIGAPPAPTMQIREGIVQIP